MFNNQSIEGRLASIEKHLMVLTTGRFPEGPKYFGLREAADLLCKSVHTLYGMVSRREIPHIKRGNRLYFKEDDLRSWLEAGKRETIINNSL